MAFILTLCIVSIELSVNGKYNRVLAQGCHQLWSVTQQVAVYPQSWVGTVIVASQGLTQVTNQVVLTVATVVSELLQVTAMSSALDGDIVAVSCSVSHTVVRVIELLSKVTPVTLTGIRILIAIT